MPIFLTENNNNVLYIVLVILLVVAAFFVFFLVSGLISWQFLLKYEKKVYASFEKVLPIEKKRKEVLNASITYVQSHHFKHNKDLIKDIQEKMNKDFDSPNSLLPVKDAMDFAEVYLKKLLEAYGRDQQAQSLIDAIQANHKESETIYASFSKIAAKYNAIFMMWPTRLINKFHKKKNRRTKISFM